MDEHGSRSGGAGVAAPSEALFAMAKARHRSGELARAAQLYGRVLGDDPGHVEALFLLGVVQHQRGEHAAAVAALEQAERLRPDVASIQAALAETSLALGRLDRAIEAAEEAVRLEPDNPMVRCIQGIALQAVGRREEAVEAFRRAIALQPEFPAAWNNLGNILRELGRLDEARAAYASAIRVAPASALAYANLGQLLVQVEQTREAGQMLARAVELEPDRPVFWRYLAELYASLDEHDQAIGCWERVVALSPTVPSSTHRALGWSLQEENRLEEAEAQYRRAEAIEPGSAEVQMLFGGLHEERGDFPGAEAAFRRAIALQPGLPQPHARLAFLLRKSLPAEDLAAIEALLERPDLAPGPRAAIQFALGQVFDTRGEYARAAACSREANALALGRASGPRRFDPPRFERFLRSLTETLPADHFSRLAGAGLETRRPVFLVGLPRTGTTLLEQVLASHPAVHGAGELHIARRLFQGLPGLMSSAESPVAALAGIDRDKVRTLARTYDERLRAAAPAGAERVIDKLPDNHLYLSFVLTLFPNATVIHCRRDLRDVALSCWMANFRSLFWTNSPEHIGAKFRGYLALMDHWRAVLPTTIHEVRYEETVDDLESVSRRVLEALGLDWDPACLEFHRLSRPVRTSSVTQVRQPLYRRSVERWRNYEPYLADLFAALPDEPPRAG